MAVESARRHLPGAAGATGTAACAFEALETFEAFESGEPLGKVVPQFGIAFSWGPHNSNFTIWFMADISKLTRVYKPTFTSLGGTTLWVIKHNHRDLYGISWDLWEDKPHSGSIYFAGSICTANTANGELRIKPNLPCPRLYGKISCGIMGN